MGAVEDGDRLGESLLGVEKNAVCVDSLCIRMAHVQEGPSEPGPRAGVIFLRDAELAPRDEGFNLRGVECEGLAEMRLRLKRATTFALENGEIDPARDEIGAELDRAMQSGCCP